MLWLQLIYRREKTLYGFRLSQVSLYTVTSSALSEPIILRPRQIGSAAVPDMATESRTKLFARLLRTPRHPKKRPAVVGEEAEVLPLDGVEPIPEARDGSKMVSLFKICTGLRRNPRTGKPQTQRQDPQQHPSVGVEEIKSRPKPFRRILALFHPRKCADEMAEVLLPHVAPVQGRKMVGKGFP